MKNRTESLRRSTVSTVKKLQASIVSAWALRNSPQLGPDLSGEGRYRDAGGCSRRLPVPGLCPRWQAPRGSGDSRTSRAPWPVESPSGWSRRGSVYVRRASGTSTCDEPARDARGAACRAAQRTDGASPGGSAGQGRQRTLDLGAAEEGGATIRRRTATSCRSMTTSMARSSLSRRMRRTSWRIRTRARYRNDRAMGQSRHLEPTQGSPVQGTRMTC
jgi:hypothetical protein